MKKEPILEASRCDRCSRLMTRDALSLLNEELVCRDCLETEKAHLARMKLEGVDPARLAAGRAEPDEEYELENRGR